MRVQVFVADDGMCAWASIVAGDASALADVDAALAAAGVCLGVDENARASLATELADPLYQIVRFDLAHGQAPVPGRDGSFEPAFHVGIQPGRLGPDGKMDFYDRELLKPAATGQALGSLRSPVAGTDGIRVDGTHFAAPTPVRPAALRLEPGVAVDPEGVVRATRDGVIVYVDGKSIDVSTELVHGRNVDLASGSIETAGSITVRGDVLPSFSVRAGGELVVEGNVDGGSLTAAGNIRVTGGILGGNTGTVTAQGSLLARHADRATIRTGGGVTLESATHCDVSAGWIEISRIRGGRSAAEQSVVAHDAGAPRGGTSTTLAAAVPLPSIADVVQAANAAKEKRTLERQAGGALRADGARAKSGKLGLSAVAQQEDELRRLQLIAHNRARLVARAFVEVSGTAYGGTQIELGEHRLLLEQDVTAVRFTIDTELNRIRQTPKT